VAMPVQNQKVEKVNHEKYETKDVAKLKIFESIRV
jgi:hypothetical protein